MALEMFAAVLLALFVRDGLRWLGAHPHPVITARIAIDRRWWSKRMPLPIRLIRSQLGGPR